MKRRGIISVVGLLGLVALLLTGSSVGASPPWQESDVPGEVITAALVGEKINYQGRLTDSGGNALDGTYDFQFRIYDAVTGGTLVEEVQVNTVAVDNGLFNVKIPVTHSDFNGQALWLEVRVRPQGGGFGDWMTPRQEILPVPYALSLRPGAVISGTVAYTGDYGGPALALLNDSGRGIYADVSGSGNAGRFIQRSGSSAVYGESVDGKGIYAVSTNNYGGYFSGSQGSLIVTGAGDGDDGIIVSDLDDTNSDLVFYTNDEFHVHLDEDDDETGTFTVYNGANNIVFQAHETNGWYGDWTDAESDTVIRTRDNLWLHLNDDNSGTAGAIDLVNGSDTICMILADDGNIYKYCGGTSSAVVSTQKGGDRRLYVMESPEVWFEDFGTGQLVNGQATVTIEPLFLETINTTDESYRVFVTPLGDCNGLYVTNKTATSFEVHELGGGESDMQFDYRIVAKRLGWEGVRMEPVSLENLEPATPVSPPDLEDQPSPGEQLTPAAESGEDLDD